MTQPKRLQHRHPRQTKTVRTPAKTKGFGNGTFDLVASPGGQIFIAEQDTSAAPRIFDCSPHGLLVAKTSPSTGAFAFVYKTLPNTLRVMFQGVQTLEMDFPHPIRSIAWISSGSSNEQSILVQCLREIHQVFVGCCRGKLMLNISSSKWHVPEAVESGIITSERGQHFFVVNNAQLTIQGFKPSAITSCGYITIPSPAQQLAISACGEWLAIVLESSLLVVNCMDPSNRYQIPRDKAVDVLQIVWAPSSQHVYFLSAHSLSIIEVADGVFVPLTLPFVLWELSQMRISSTGDIAILCKNKILFTRGTYFTPHHLSEPLKFIYWVGSKLVGSLDGSDDSIIFEF